MADDAESGIKKELEEGNEAPINNDLLYTVGENPPLYLCLILGFQHYLTMFGGTLSIPLFLSKYLCMDEDTLGLSELISTIFFVSGICTLLQTTFGTRLPIVQGGTFAFLVPSVAIMTLAEWKCPYVEAREEGSAVNLTSLPEPGSADHREMWQMRLREIQGAIMVSSIFQILIGFSGLMGVVLRYVGPLAITPTITLIGLALFGEAAEKAATHWWISLTTVVLIAMFSQYMRNISIPCFVYKRGKGCVRHPFPVFSLFPVLLAMVICWVLCAILTATGALPDDPNAWGYKARTDTNTEVLQTSQWFRFPYPGQWGMPTVSLAGVFGMLAGVLSSMVESVGDYYACARLGGAPPPPIHVVNRGIGIEGVGCLLSGAWGSGNGTTSYSENIGAIGITKVGSRRVVQAGGLIMIILGCLGKFGALFVTIPEPVVGGMFLVMFGMVTAVGLSNLQYVNLNSARNIFILGVSLFFGLSLSNWIKAHDPINTGNAIADQIITSLCSTSMFVGGLVGFVLDNTIPGTDEERGINTWRQLETGPGGKSRGLEVYDLPWIQKYFDRRSWSKYIPVYSKFSQNVENQEFTRRNSLEKGSDVGKKESTNPLIGQRKDV